MNEAEDFKKLIRDSYESQQPEPPDADLLWQKIKVKTVLKPWYKTVAGFSSIVAVSVALIAVLVWAGSEKGGNASVVKNAATHQEPAKESKQPMAIDSNHHAIANGNVKAMSDSSGKNKSNPNVAFIFQENNAVNATKSESFSDRNAAKTLNITDKHTDTNVKQNNPAKGLPDNGVQTTASGGAGQKAFASGTENGYADSVKNPDSFKQNTIDKTTSKAADSQQTHFDSLANVIANAPDTSAGKDELSKHKSTGNEFRLKGFVELNGLIPLTQTSVSILKNQWSPVLGGGVMYSRKSILFRTGISLELQRQNSAAIFREDTILVMDSAGLRGTRLFQYSGFKASQFHIGIPLEAGYQIGKSHLLTAGITFWIPVSVKGNYTYTDRFIPTDSSGKATFNSYRMNAGTLSMSPYPGLQLGYQYQVSRWYAGIGANMQFSHAIRSSGTNMKLPEVPATLYLGFRAGMYIGR